MNSNVHYMYPGATPRSKMYKNYDFMKPLKYVLVWYMLLWCYMISLCDIDVWYMKGLWCKQWMTSYDTNSSYESICSMHVCCVYVLEWYCYDFFVCMMHVPYETKELKWGLYEAVWRKYERMTFSGTNETNFGNKWDASLLNRKRQAYCVYYSSIY